MLHKLINHNPDLRRLVNERFEVEIVNGYLIIHNIPYLNSSKEIKRGSLVSAFNLQGDIIKQFDHVALFYDGQPCNQDGTPIKGIGNSIDQKVISKDLTTNILFSSKPPEGYRDFYEKMTRYIDIISAPAKSIDQSLTAKSNKPFLDSSEESVLNLIDTNSSRANINDINLLFNQQKIAIVGVGGTGSHILDLISKTQVSQIHLFDGDKFLTHNYFRSPGVPNLKLIEDNPNKADYFKAIYSVMHKKIESHNYHITEANLNELSEMNFVFISIDKGQIKKALMDYLIANNISFIDVGMGIERGNDKLTGVLRTTIFSNGETNHLFKHITSGTNNDEYLSNIQIAELNSLNASMAVIKWKKLLGFYHDFRKENLFLYSINDSLLINE